eukprot:14113741-Alexandrium_andersonii.AAC.1
MTSRWRLCRSADAPAPTTAWTSWSRPPSPSWGAADRWTTSPTSWPPSRRASLTCQFGTAWEDPRRASRACQGSSLLQEPIGSVSTVWTRSASTDQRAG